MWIVERVPETSVSYVEKPQPCRGQMRIFMGFSVYTVNHCLLRKGARIVFPAAKGNGIRWNHCQQDHKALRGLDNALKVCKRAL